jgi:hypothetical protein
MSTHIDSISAYRSELRRAATRLRRARRRRRILIACAAALTVVVTGSLAVAARNEGWLTGEPAPPTVVQGFGQYTPQLGFHPKAGKAQFVAEDGPIKLYATANREGGICYLVDEPWKPANAGDGGTCASRKQAAVPISAGGLGGSQAVQVIGGRVADGRAVAISFSTPTGEPIVRPLGAGGFYVAQVPWNGHCPDEDWNPVFVALGSGGEKLVEATIMLLQIDRDRQDRVVACGGSVTPVGPDWQLPAGGGR